MKQILSKIQENVNNKKKTLAILIDPDKFDKIKFEEIDNTHISKIDFVFIGGSLIITQKTNDEAV
jgi:heptaprenylglyceryl phosphate synthase